MDSLDSERIVMDDGWVSSNPGGVAISKLRYARFYPVWSLGWVGALIVSILLAIFVHWFFWIPSVVFLGINAFYWRYVKESFMHGDTRPGRVISLDPPLFACSTNLSKHGEDLTAVKIIRKPIPATRLRNPSVGMKLAAVTTYFEDSESDPFWTDIAPIPVEFVTSDPVVIAAKLETLTQSDWEGLDDCLAKLRKNAHPGLYKFPKTAAK